MSIFASFTPSRLWQFMGLFQPVGIRVLHALVTLGVLLQMLSSAFMHRGNLSAWYHMREGLVVSLLGLAFIGYTLSRHGVKHFFPYAWGEWDLLARDLRGCREGRLPAPRPGGLDAAIQGVGLVALLGAGLSGSLWFCFGLSGVAGRIALGVHGVCGSLLVGYVCVHGLLGALRFAAWQRNTAKS